MLLGTGKYLGDKLASDPTPELLPRDPNAGSHEGTIIFVHGFLGKSKSSWTVDEDKPSALWPSWIGKAYPKMLLVNVGYEQSIKGQGLTVFKQSKVIFGALEAKPEIFEKPFIFACHSMGGLIAKQMILSAQQRNDQEFLGNLRGIAFFGTPHRGSGMATGVHRLLFGALMRSEILDLMLNGSYIEFLRESYNTHADEVQPHLQHVTFRESKPTKGFRIVSDASGELEVKNAQSYERNTNHFDVCKFFSTEEIGYVQFKNFLEKAFVGSSALDDPVKYSTSVERQGDSSKLVGRFGAVFSGFLGILLGLLIVYFVDGGSLTNFSDIERVLIEQTMSLALVLGVCLLFALTFSLVIFRGKSPLFQLLLGLIGGPAIWFLIQILIFAGEFVG